MSNKIYSNHTLEEYNKKYGNKNLKKINKVDADKNPGLLKDHSWWLIKDTYYEIPNNKGFKGWWAGLGKGGQIALSCLAGAAVVTAIVVPTVIAVSNKTVNHEAVIDPEVTGVTCSQKKLDNGALEVTLAYDTDKKELESLDIYIGNTKLIIGTDYTLDGNKVVINKDVLEKNKEVKIVLKPKLKDKKTVYVTGITCKEKLELSVGDEISFDKLEVKITPDDATDKTFNVLKGGKSNDENPIEIDNENKKIKAIETGSATVQIIPNGTDPESEEGIGAYCDITVNPTYKKVTEQEWKDAIKSASKQSKDSNFTIYNYEEKLSQNGGSSGPKYISVQGYNIKIDEFNESGSLEDVSYEKETQEGLIEELESVDSEYYINRIGEKNDDSFFFGKTLDDIYDEFNNYNLFTYNDTEKYFERTTKETTNGGSSNETLRLKFNHNNQLVLFQKIDNDEKTVENYEFSDYGNVVVSTPEQSEIKNFLTFNDIIKPGEVTTSDYTFKGDSINTVYCTLDLYKAGVDNSKDIKFTLTDGTTTLINSNIDYCFVNDKKVTISKHATETCMVIPASYLTAKNNIITFVMDPGYLAGEQVLHGLVIYTPKA